MVTAVPARHLHIAMLTMFKCLAGTVMTVFAFDETERLHTAVT